jgi:signal transduction histidine kinase
VCVPLLRGGRVIGALHASGRVDLSPQRTRTFVTVAERIGTALANARQFERERETVRRLTEIDRLQNEFLGTVSHELQTPITAILGFSSMLDEQYDDLTPEERRDFVRRVSRNATSLSRLVRELLDFSRLGRRQFELHPHEIDLSELTTRIIDQFAGLVERHRIVLDAPAGIWALADIEAVERVLSNLLSNAAKYSPADTTITVTLSHVGDEARITVDDAGPGVAEEDAPHVFHRFYRGNSPAAVKTRGAGIGLAVVKELVDRMGGSVSVGVSPQGGARFTVILPVHKREPAVPDPPPEPAGQGRVP